MKYMSMLAITLSLAIGLLSAQDEKSEKTGIIAGKIIYTGPPPKIKKVTTSDGGVIEQRDLVVDAKSNGLQHVFVTLVGDLPRTKQSGGKPVVVDQAEMVFVPRVVAVRQGQPVVFTNSDNCNHSVMAISPIRANSFNIFTPANGGYKATFVPQTKPIVVGCSLHPWMRAWVYVSEHPWFAVTDARGKFRIAGIPPGEYQLRCEHADTHSSKTIPVVVRAGKVTQVSMDWWNILKERR